MGLEVVDFLDDGMGNSPTCVKTQEPQAAVLGWRICGHKSSCGGDDGLTFLGPQHTGGNWNDSWVQGCWDIKNNLNRWVCVEFSWDAINERAKLWIDDTLMIDRHACSDFANTLSTFILSGWSSCYENNVDAVTYYADNIVIATDYIGPVN